jgi:hypothetical protein
MTSSLRRACRKFKHLIEMVSARCDPCSTIEYSAGIGPGNHFISSVHGLASSLLTGIDFAAPG